MDRCEKSLCHRIIDVVIEFPEGGHRRSENGRYYDRNLSKCIFGNFIAWALLHVVVHFFLFTWVRFPVPFVPIPNQGKVSTMFPSSDRSTRDT